MSRLSRRTKISLAFVLIVLTGFVVGRFGFSSSVVPKEFEEARLQGALIAQDIVNLSNQIGKDLEQVNRLDRERKHDEALAVTAAIVKKSQEVRSRAVDLSRELEKMTRALAAIKSTEARGAALESIANRLTIINRLINYSDYLAQLLGALEAKFEGVPSDYQIALLIHQINAEVTAVNSFNRQASQAMERFDAIISN